MKLVIVRGDLCHQEPDFSKEIVMIPIIDFRDKGHRKAAIAGIHLLLRFIDSSLITNIINL
jgi:hypothetical protein